LKLNSSELRENFNKMTDTIYYGADNYNFLTKHLIQCNSKEDLQRFWRRFSLFAPNEYKCIFNEAIGASVVTNQTQSFDLSGKVFTSFYILNCEGGYGLQGFKSMSTRNNISYVYSCVNASIEQCSPKEEIEVVSAMKMTESDNYYERDTQDTLQNDTDAAYNALIITKQIEKKIKKKKK